MPAKCEGSTPLSANLGEKVKVFYKAGKKHPNLPTFSSNVLKSYGVDGSEVCGHVRKKSVIFTCCPRRTDDDEGTGLDSTNSPEIAAACIWNNERKPKCSRTGTTLYNIYILYITTYF